MNVCRINKQLSPHRKQIPPCAHAYLRVVFVILSTFRYVHRPLSVPLSLSFNHRHMHNGIRRFFCVFICQILTQVSVTLRHAPQHFINLPLNPRWARQNLHLSSRRNRSTPRYCLPLSATQQECYLLQSDRASTFVHTNVYWLIVCNSFDHIDRMICFYAALLPRRGPHIASHSVCPSVCLSICPSICPSVRPSR